MNFRTFKIKEKLVDLAKSKSREMGAIDGSITGGKGNVAAFVGEYLARNVYGGKIENTYDYDLVLPNNKKADAKTKRTSVTPQDYYECSIYAGGEFQKCDIYIFVRVDLGARIGWVLGSIDKKEYFEKARFLKKGDYDPDNNFYVKHDCYNLPISGLIECPQKSIIISNQNDMSWFTK